MVWLNPILFIIIIIINIIIIMIMKNFYTHNVNVLWLNRSRGMYRLDYSKAMVKK